MCDQNHFDDDLKEYTERGLVTRRQFGALVGAGFMMMLPQVVGAVAVTESDVTIKTPDGTCDASFVHPATGSAPACSRTADGLRFSSVMLTERVARTCSMAKPHFNP